MPRQCIECYACHMNSYCMVPESIHTHPKEDHWKFRGEGVSKATILKGKYEAKLEILGGKG